MKLKKIGLIFGGVSTEHDISVRSSFFIYKTLDRSLFQVLPIFIDPVGRWYIPTNFESQFPDPEEFPGVEFLPAFLSKNEILLGSDKHLIPSLHLDAVFIGLHGGQGENGSVQGFLEVLGISYTGSGVTGSALAMDKLRSNQLFAQIGIAVAPFVEVTKKNTDVKRFVLKLPIAFPVFIKPTLGGSSVNTGPAHSPEEAITLIEKIFVSEDRVLIQELISGMEVSIGVLEKQVNEKWEAFPLVATEINPKSGFFDFSAKYSKGGSEEITPARVSDDIMAKIKTYALLCHETLGCRGYSRTDFIIKNNIPYVLETNTLPGMTGTSLIPKQAAAMGIQMKDVFTWLLEQAISP